MRYILAPFVATLLVWLISAVGAVGPDNFQVSPAYTTTPASTVSPSSTPMTSEKIGEHDQLIDDLDDEKKRFDQKYLDCDDGLKKIVAEIEAGIRTHDHDKAKKMLDEMKVYKSNDVTDDPCHPPAPGKEGKAASKSGTEDKNKSDQDKDKKNGKNSGNK